MARYQRRSRPRRPAAPVAGAQPAAPTLRIVKIGVLTTAWSPWHSNTEGFRDGLKEFGYVEGRNLRFELRAAQERHEVTVVEAPAKQ
jgi:hypothetical protein